VRRVDIHPCVNPPFTVLGENSQRLEVNVDLFAHGNTVTEPIALSPYRIEWFIEAIHV
jgi:hypothetical protein